MNSTIKTGGGQSKLIFDESPLTFSRTIAHAIGLPKAIILQQIYFLNQQPNSGEVLEDGFNYIYNSYEEWKKEFFPFWSIRSLKTYFLELEKAGLLVSRQPNKSDWNGKKYYRVDFVKFSKWSADFIGYEKNSNKIGSAKIAPSVVQDLHSRTCNNCTISSANSAPSSIQRRHTKKTYKEDDTNISLASDDAGKIIPDKISIPETSLMVVSGAIPAADKSLHQQLMAMSESFIGKLTSSGGGKEAKGSKNIREYIDKNPDTTLQDVRDCFVWIRENKRMMQLSLTSVASQLPTYMAIKRKSGKVPGTQFLTAQEKNDEIRQNRDYKKIAENINPDKWRIKNFEEKPITEIEKSVPGTQFKSAKERSDERLLNMDTKQAIEDAQKVYDELKSIISDKPITEIERLVPGTQFKTAQEKSLETFVNRDYNELISGAQKLHLELAEKIGTKRKV